MLNPVFFILSYPIISGNGLPKEENLYYSILVNPSESKGLTMASELLDRVFDPAFSLTLDIGSPITPENIRAITAILFQPGYFHAGDKRMVHLMSTLPAKMLTDISASLKEYLLLQGISDLSLYRTGISENESSPGDPLCFHDPAGLTDHYAADLQAGRIQEQPLFFCAASTELLQSAYLSLKTAEDHIKRHFPGVYSLISQYRLQEKELYSVRSTLSATAMELANQRQYVDILRSNHATKELQDHYTREYEILPLWYKRFGQIIKVLTGKRTFRSLFRDDVKKYKD